MPVFLVMPSFQEVMFVISDEQTKVMLTSLVEPSNSTDSILLIQCVA